MQDFDNGQIDMFSKTPENKPKKKKVNERVQKVLDIQPKGTIFEKTVEEVLHSSMLPYSEYVILDRALPRVEDGLKPVQRRILYTMLELGVTPDKPYRKSAKVVGDVLGKYHPHGDSSIYDAMVRMAQDFVMSRVLVKGHGNFGSIDGDGAAAYRYTEVKLSELAMELMRDLDKETVNFSLNFDDTLKEPDYFPGRYPNLLVNGSSGIAVGLATNIPPHNLDEVIDAVVCLIDNPNCTLADLMKCVKGPDFPTGGVISAGKDLIEAYETGRGKVVVRAKFHTEDLANGKTNIVITEMPYQVNKALFLQHVVEVKEKVKGALNDIVEILDESDKNGMRAVITCKKDADVQSIISLLLKHTEMQQNFNLNMVAIAGGRPKQLGLLDIIKYYVDFQVDVIYKRTKYDHAKAKARAHILEGLLVAIKNIDEVIQIIKASESTLDAKKRLMERFSLTEVQAVAILDMKLSRLTNLEIYKIEQELAELEKLIIEYEKILASKARQLGVVKKEILDIKKRFPTPRRTDVVEEHETYQMTPIETLINQECLVAVSEDGIRLKNVIINSQLNTSGNFESYNTTNVLHKDMVKTNTLSHVMCFTNLGNMYKIAVGDIPVCKYIGKGTNLSQIVKAEVNEKIIAIFDMEEFKQKGELLMFTKDGYIKRTELNEFLVTKPVVDALGLRDLDRLVAVQLNYNLNGVLMVTEQGMVVICEYNSVPVQKRAGTGVIGINLNDGDKVVYASQVNLTDKMLVVDSLSNAKRVSLNELSVSARNRKGLKIAQADKIVFVQSPIVTGELVLTDAKNNIITKDVNDVPVVSRTLMGKPLIKNKQTQKIKSINVYIN